MNYISKFWLESGSLFDPVQRFFNGNFWDIFEKKFGKFKNKKVIDIACGTGELKKHISPKYYLGVDINKSYIKLCKERFETKNIKFELADATKIKLDKNFDTAFFVGSIHHFEDTQVLKLLKNIKTTKIKELIICDGIPFGFFKPLLVFLDDVLGGGKYFRTETELFELISKYFVSKKSGRLKTSGSFYLYPYWVLKPLQK